MNVSLHNCLLALLAFLIIPGGSVSYVPEPLGDSNTQRPSIVENNVHKEVTPPSANNEKVTTSAPNVTNVNGSLPTNATAVIPDLSKKKNSDNATNSVLPEMTSKTTPTSVPPPPSTVRPAITPKPTPKQGSSEASDMAQKKHPDVVIHPDKREDDVRHSNSAHSKPQPFRHESPDIFMPNASKETHGNTTAAAYAAAICIAAAAVFYGSIVVWKRYAENRERNRGMLLTEDDMADLNDPDLRVFELKPLSKDGHFINE